MSIWKTEHGRDFAVPEEIENLVKEGFMRDESWHNDVCPCFARHCPYIGETTIRLWVAHPDPQQREGMLKRYAVAVEPEGYASESQDAIVSDDLAEVLRTLHWADRMLQSRFRDLRSLEFSGDMPPCVNNFGDVHNFCDANMLGDAEGLMDEACKVYGAEDGDITDRAREWYTGILNAVDHTLDHWLGKHASETLHENTPPDQLARLIVSNNKDMEEQVVARVLGMSHQDQEQFYRAFQEGGWGRHRLIALMEAARRLGAKSKEAKSE